MLIAALAEYPHWTGARPHPLEKRRALHYWGQFSRELPEPYRQEGGHVYRPAEDYASLVAERDALMRAVQTKFPDVGVEINDAGDTVHLVLPDGRQMWIEMSPSSEYEEACELGRVGVHAFPGGSAVIWDKEGGGVVSVGVSATGDELVLLRTWVDHDEHEAVARAFVDAPPEDEETSEATFRCDDTRIVVAYAPIALADTDVEEDELRERSSDGSPVSLRTDEDADVAAVLALRPGRYALADGAYEPEDEDAGWSCIWCRLTRLNDADA